MEKLSINYEFRLE